uniref:Chaperone DnaJ C-terminal domain-containing protein n=1 Tax=Oryza meridionalis TaxID=40149 RepID=A0A0E0EBW5_9ORYZ
MRRRWQDRGGVGRTWAIRPMGMKAERSSPAISRGRLLSWEEEEEKNVVSSSSLRSPAFLLRVLLPERRFFSFVYEQKLREGRTGRFSRRAAPGRRRLRERRTGRFSRRAAPRFKGYDIMKDDIGTSYGDLPDHKEFTTSAMEYIDSTRCSLLGEYKKLNVWIVKERIKCCVRSMAVELFNQHEEGYCLSRFGESNIWVAPTGHIRFRLVTRTKRTDELVCQNYLDLRNVIRPTDWRSLMSLMLHNPHEHGYLICNYAPLIPIENRILFYFRAYEHMRFVLAYTNDAAYRDILKKLPYQNRWFQITEGNYLLEASLKHKNYGVDDNPEKAHDPETFFKYYRHSNCHRLDRCFMIEEVGGYSAEQFELIFIVKYPLFLPLLQQELQRYNQLRCLKPHTLFFYGNIQDAEQSCAMIYHDQLDNPQATVGELMCTLEELYQGTDLTVALHRRITRHTDEPVENEEIILQVKVLPGSRKGTKITLPYEGSHFYGQPPHDLILTLDIAPHETYILYGNDLVVHWVLRLVDALAKCTINLKTLDGRYLKIKVDEVVYPGYELVIKDEGWPIGEGLKGNLRIIFDRLFS